MKIDKSSYRRLLRLVVIGVLLLVGLQHLRPVWSVISTVLGCFAPIIGGLCVAFILNVPLRGLEETLLRRLPRRLRRALSIIITLVLTLGVVLLIVVVLYSDLSDCLDTLMVKLPIVMEDVQEWLTGSLNSLTLGELELPELKLDMKDVVHRIAEYLSSGTSGSLFGTAADLTGTVLSKSYNVLFALIVSIYVLADKERIGRFTDRALHAFLPEGSYRVVKYIAHLSYVSFSNFIGGQLTDAVILAFLCFIGMKLFGFPYAMVVSMVIFLGALVPVVGAITAGVLGALLILTESPLQALLFLVFLIVLQQLEGNLIYPRIVGRSVGLPGIIVLCSVLVGGDLFGIVGAITAVPVCAVLYVLLREMISLREKKNHPVPAAENADAQKE